MANNTPRPTSYTDIRKGDKVQIEFMDRDTRVIREATAFGKNYTNDWVTEQGAPLYFAYPDTAYSLLERPAPPLPDKAGSIIRIDKYYSDYREENLFPDSGTYAVLDGDGDWIVIVEDYHKYVDPSDVLEWSPVNVTVGDEAL